MQSLNNWPDRLRAFEIDGEYGKNWVIFDCKSTCDNLPKVIAGVTNVIGGLAVDYTTQGRGLLSYSDRRGGL